MAKGGAGEKPFRQFRRDVLKAAAQARVRAEVQVRKVSPLAWLRYGPGRDRPGEPGWTERAHAEPEPLEVPSLILDEADARAARAILIRERRRIEAEKAAELQRRAEEAVNRAGAPNGAG